MDPARKRTVRFVVALTTAMLLSGALVYTSFGASTETVQPSQLAAAEPDRIYELTGKVERGTWENGGDTHAFRVEDRNGGNSVPVTYAGPVPDPFREGREVIIDVRKQGDTWVGEPNSLITKCPSKFTAEEQQQ